MTFFTLLVVAFFGVLVGGEARAEDSECLGKAATDQTIWDGQDGTMRYCTSNTPSGYEVSFGGVVEQRGSVDDSVEILTVVEFSVVGRVGEAPFLIKPSNPLVPEVAGTAFFPPPVPVRILP